MKMKSTKRALLMSALSLLLCCSMLIGTTFAWFTDEVKSGNNIIKSGNLDVELYHSNSYIQNEKVGGLTDLFTVEEGKTFLWEPGAVLWENFKVANEGTLALKYQLMMNFTNATKTAEGKSLADVLKVAVIAGGFNGTREQAQQLNYNYSLYTFALEGKLDGKTVENGETKIDNDVYGIVIYWQPTADDNDYNVVGGLSIDLGVNLFATQVTAESDSFDNNYDVDAWEDTKNQRPEVDSSAANINSDGSASMEVNAAPSANTNKTTVDAPAGTYKPTDKVEVKVETDNSLFNVSAAGGVVATLDITMTVNGQKTSAALADGKVYTVTTYISKGLTNVTVAYTGTDGTQPTNVTYDAVTGKLTFQTSHFSEYAVSGEALAYDVVNDTALVTIEAVVEATKVENSTVVIPEENKAAIEDAIKELPVEEQAAASAATAAAKIGEKTYATLDAAFEAAKDGDTIVVLNNIATSTAIINTKDITLDLNGYTISGTDNATASFGLITNNGTLTIIGNGKITLVATNNRAWNAYSSVISNQPGGKLVVENGTLEHLGGTDMAYGIDNLTNGKGTYAEVVINGGLVKSTYRAIRQFLNGIEAENILTVNGGTIEGANKSIWMQDPSKNDNTGKLTVSKNAVLKGDVYLFVTAGSAKWPVEVSIADAALVKGEIITGNVPLINRVELVDGAWVVLSSDAAVTTTEELKAALAAGKKDIAIAAGTYTFPSITDKDVVLRCAEGVVFTGTSGLNINGATVIGATFDAGNTSTSATGTVNGIFKDCTFTGGSEGVRWCYTNENTVAIFENCVFEATLRGVHFDAMDGNVTFIGCEINGFNAIGGTATVTFEGCTFGNDESPYNGLNLYCDTVLTDCTFNFTSGKTNFIDMEGTGKTLTITNCTATLDGEDTSVAAFVGGSKFAVNEVIFNGGHLVKTADELVAALEAGKDVVFANDIKIDPANMSNAYGKTGINVKNGQTIDGNGFTLNIKGAGGTWDSGINTTGGLIKNLTVTGSFRGIFINHTSTYSEKVVLENVIIGGNGTVYTISCDQGLYQGIEATNCTFNGWTSFAKTAGEAKFVNCTFGEGSGYAYCRPYSNTEFVNCTFSEGYAVDTTQATVTFTDCTKP